MTNLTAELMHHGTPSRSKDQLAKDIDLLGGHLRTSFNRENLDVTLSFESGRQE